MEDNLYFKPFYNSGSILDSGISNEQIFIYSKDNYIYIIENNIRCFKASFKRLRNVMCMKLNNDIKNIIIENIKNIKLVHKNENSCILTIEKTKKINFNYNCKYDIKLKEVNDFLNINNNDNYNLIIKKLYKKIDILIKKINEYENKHKEPTTEEEMFINY